MLVIDSSAIAAMIFDEAEGAACAAVLGQADGCVLSAANYVEIGTVLAGRIVVGSRETALADLDRFLALFGIDIAPVSPRLARAAVRARLRYGKGFGLRKGLNFGDCFAYALAMDLAVPLLYVGDDFAITDVPSAIPRRVE